jgi:hypothetical protein
MFLVSDNLNILPSSKVNSLMMLLELGCSDLTQLEEVTHNIGKQEVINVFCCFCLMLYCIYLRIIILHQYEVCSIQSAVVSSEIYYS